ncbi:DUF5131 family protein [Streptomyces coerulescens]|uniref:DUF5131 family protein n=1 Tax=Streptomyces coerulescens TaxID=29304 RepID=A0ABW0CUP8_STRCD
MSTSTTIEWTDVTWHPTTGCDRISPGCDNCHELKRAKRLKATGQAKYQRDGDPRTSGPGFATMALGPQHQFQVLAKRPRQLRRLLDSQQFVDSVWAEVERLSAYGTAPLTRLVPEDVRTRVVNRNALNPWPLPNVWISTSIESDEYSWRADELRRTPAAVRFAVSGASAGPGAVA